MITLEGYVKKNPIKGMTFVPFNPYMKCDMGLIKGRNRLRKAGFEFKHGLLGCSDKVLIKDSLEASY